MTFWQASRTTVCTLVLAIFLLNLLQCQSNGVEVADEDNGPEAIALQALTALKEDRIPDYVDKMHPRALESLRSMMLDVVDAAEEAGGVDDFLRIFDNVNSADHLRQLDETEFFTAFLNGMLRIQPQIRDMLEAMEMEVLGHIREKEDLVHVVYRGIITQDDANFTTMTVVSLKADGDSWGMLLTSEIENMAAMLRLEFEVPD